MLTMGKAFQHRTVLKHILKAFEINVFKHKSMCFPKSVCLLLAVLNIVRPMNNKFCLKKNEVWEYFIATKCIFFLF